MPPVGHQLEIEVVEGDGLAQPEVDPAAVLCAEPGHP